MWRQITDLPGQAQPANWKYAATAQNGSIGPAVAHKKCPRG
jgi:hypothetical protein